jgi:hypothetical protein
LKLLLSFAPKYDRIEFNNVMDCSVESGRDFAGLDSVVPGGSAQLLQLGCESDKIEK